MPWNYRKKRLIDAVIAGDPSINPWLAVSWRDHYVTFASSAALIVRFEALLDNPADQCRKILMFLGCRRTPAEIAEAIANQAFARKKEQYRERQQWYQYRFVRSGYRKTEFSESEKLRFSEAVAEQLGDLAYEAG